MNLQVGKVLYKTLYQSLKDEVGKKIFPLVADNGTTFPFVTYRRLNLTPDNTKDVFITSHSAEMEVTIAADKYEQSVKIAEMAIDALSELKGEYGDVTIKRTTIDNVSEDFNEDTYLQIITLNLKIE